VILISKLSIDFLIPSFRRPLFLANSISRRYASPIEKGEMVRVFICYLAFKLSLMYQSSDGDTPYLRFVRAIEYKKGPLFI